MVLGLEIQNSGNVRHCVECPSPSDFVSLIALSVPGVFLLEADHSPRGAEGNAGGRMVDLVQ